MEETYRKIESKFYKMVNTASIAGFFIGGAMQMIGGGLLEINGNNDALIEAGMYTTLLSGGYWLSRKFAEKQFKKTSDLENRLE